MSVADNGPASITDQALALMERISASYADGEPAREAADAREDFLLATGRVHEGDRSFDERMALFMEWFLLDRPLRGATPAEGWAESHAAQLSKGEIDLLVALVTSHRSLFDLVSVDDVGRLVTDDLLQGIRFVVTPPDRPLGVRPGDVFEGRVFGHGGEVHFTAAFCYHPPEAAQRIRHYLAQVRESRLEPGSSLLDELMSLRLAYDRAEGAPVNSIYRLGR